MHAAGWILIVLGCLGAGGLALDLVRQGMEEDRVGGLVMGLLVACSLLAIAVIGYGCGLGGDRRAPLTVPLAILIATALWITIDLDHPRAGLMQLSDAPLEALEFETPGE